MCYGIGSAFVVTIPAIVKATIGTPHKKTIAAIEEANTFAAKFSVSIMLSRLVPKETVIEIIFKVNGEEIEPIIVEY